jgi:hypothetical protein
LLQQRRRRQLCHRLFCYSNTKTESDIALPLPSTLQQNKKGLLQQNQNKWQWQRCCHHLLHYSKEKKACYSKENDDNSVITFFDVARPK